MPSRASSMAPNNRNARVVIVSHLSPAGRQSCRCRSFVVASSQAARMLGYQVIIHGHYRTSRSLLQGEMMAQRHQSGAAGHRVFLLTLWQEVADTPWRAALRAADSQQRIGFADLEALALFLLRLDECIFRPLIA